METDTYFDLRWSELLDSEGDNAVKQLDTRLDRLASEAARPALNRSHSGSLVGSVWAYPVFNKHGAITIYTDLDEYYGFWSPVRDRLGNLLSRWEQTKIGKRMIAAAECAIQELRK